MTHSLAPSVPVFLFLPHYDTDAKSGPNSIVGIGLDTDIAIDIAKGTYSWKPNKRDGV